MICASSGRRFAEHSLVGAREGGDGCEARSMRNRAHRPRLTRARQACPRLAQPKPLRIAGDGHTDTVTESPLQRNRRDTDPTRKIIKIPRTRRIGVKPAPRETDRSRGRARHINSVLRCECGDHGLNRGGSLYGFATTVRELNKTGIGPEDEGGTCQPPCAAVKFTGPGLSRAARQGEVNHAPVRRADGDDRVVVRVQDRLPCRHAYPRAIDLETDRPLNHDRQSHARRAGWQFEPLTRCNADARHGHFGIAKRARSRSRITSGIDRTQCRPFYINRRCAVRSHEPSSICWTADASRLRTTFLRARRCHEAAVGTALMKSSPSLSSGPGAAIA